jgi:hypothetical protein
MRPISVITTRTLVDRSAPCQLQCLHRHRNAGSLCWPFLYQSDHARQKLAATPAVGRNAFSYPRTHSSFSRVMYAAVDVGNYIAQAAERLGDNRKGWAGLIVAVLSPEMEPDTGVFRVSLDYRDLPS